MLVATDDRKARVWDVETGKVRMLIESFRVNQVNMAVNCAAFSPDGRQALTVADDKTARLWDLESGKELRRLVGLADEVGALAFVADGRGIVSVSRTGMAWQWDAESGKALQQQHPGACKQGGPPATGEGRYAWPVVLSPDGRRVLLAGIQGVNGVWDVQTGKQIQRLWI